MGNTTNALEKLLANTEMNKKEVAVCLSRAFLGCWRLHVEVIGMMKVLQ